MLFILDDGISEYERSKYERLSNPKLTISVGGILNS